MARTACPRRLIICVVSVAVNAQMARETGIDALHMNQPARLRPAFSNTQHHADEVLFQSQS
jgi:hypothetical protein